MIEFSISIPWLWARDINEPMRDYFLREEHLFGNKWYCLQFSKSRLYHLFQLRISLSFRGRDHAGPSLSLDIGRYMFEAYIYDCRHWDYEKGTWADVNDNDHGV